MLFYVNLLLKIHAIAHLHELMRVARIAVLAGKLAATIGVDRPSEGHLPLADAAVKEGANRQGEILDLMPLAQRLPLGSEAGNAHEFRTRIGEERKRGHRLIFAFYSPMIISRVGQCKPKIAGFWIEDQSGEIKIHLGKLRLGGVASGYWTQPVTLPSR